MDETLSRRLAPRRAEEAQAESVRAPDFAGHNAFASDPVLTACVDTLLDEGVEDELRATGAYWGSAEAQEVARIAADHGPTLRQRDAEGRSIDQVELHPAYHALLNRSIVAGLLSSAWEDGEDHRQHRLRAATLYLTAGCDRGHLVPVTATHAAVAALAHAPDLEAELFPLIASRRYDRRTLPLADKDGALVAFALGEREAGGDRTALATRADPADGDRVIVSGEKWFVAAPQSDILLVLCQTAKGPTVAMVPRHGAQNAGAVRVEALTPALGLASQAVGTVTFDRAEGRIIGEAGRGLQVLREVRTLTQLDSALVAAGAMRGAIARAAHNARYRRFGGAALIADPLAARVLADLALESAAQTALAARLATAFDLAYERDGDHAIARIVTPAARVYALKAAAAFSAEACDAIGINAFGAGHPAARIAADLLSLSDRDGTANEAAAELALTVARNPTVLRDALDELGADLGQQNADIVEDVERLGDRVTEDLSLARVLAEQLAMVAAGAAMRRNLPRVVADAYITSRLRDRYRAGYGALDGRFDAAAIIDFVVPEG